MSINPRGERVPKASSSTIRNGTGKKSLGRPVGDPGRMNGAYRNPVKRCKTQLIQEKRIKEKRKKHLTRTKKVEKRE